VANARSENGGLGSAAVKVRTAATTKSGPCFAPAIYVCITHSGSKLDDLLVRSKNLRQTMSQVKRKLRGRAAHRACCCEAARALLPWFALGGGAKRPARGGALTWTPLVGRSRVRSAPTGGCRARDRRGFQHCVCVSRPRQAEFQYTDCASNPAILCEKPGDPGGRSAQQLMHTGASCAVLTCGPAAGGAATTWHCGRGLARCV
jgi:hypothetical protein